MDILGIERFNAKPDNNFTRLPVILLPTKALYKRGDMEASLAADVKLAINLALNGTPLAS